MPTYTAGPTLTRLAREVLLHLPPGPCLDKAVLAWRPQPHEITSQPSEDVLTQLSRRRNLYGLTLRAATTDNVDTLTTHPGHDKVRVQRALGLNPHLTIEQARLLAHTADTTSDAGMLLALIKRSPYVAVLLSEHPRALRLISARPSQPGPHALAERLNDLEPFEVPMLSTTFYPNGRREASLRNSPAGALTTAINAYLYLLVHDKVYPHLPTLAAMAETLLPAAVGWGARPPLPISLSEPITALPGKSILAITQLFSVLPPSATGDSPPRLDRASEASLEAALSYPRTPQDPPLGRALPTWSTRVTTLTAAWIAPQLNSFEQLESLNVLAKEWNDTLDRLIQVAIAL